MTTTTQASDLDQRLAWWREARFGMFIHWGLYAIPAGEWNGQNYPGASEWLMLTAKIKPSEYAPLRPQFNPVQYDAREWVRIAKDAGMKYIVITSKHHDGFALWHTKQNDWHIGNTPFKRDALKELVVACKEAGIKLCFYHSIMDWTHPDYLPRRPWDDRAAREANFERYVEFMKAQLAELLNGDYGDIGILWFDGEWEDTWTHERGKDLYAYVRSLQPNIIINNRVDKGRDGMAGLTQGDFMGDYGTPEQEIPPNGLPGIDWESCMTMNDSWGFHKNDHNWKSALTLIQQLIDCASKGGNYLLNVGPDDLGRIPAASVERLRAVGDWTRKYGDSIYGSHAGPFERPLRWGRVTSKPGKLFLHVFDDSARTIELPGLVASVTRVRDMLTGEVVAHGPINGVAGVKVTLPERRDGPVPVYVLEYSGEIRVERILQRPAADGSFDLRAEDALVKGHARYEAGDKRAIGFWTNVSDTITWTFQVPRAGEYSVELEYACDPASAGSEVEVRADKGGVTTKIGSTGSWSAFQRAAVGRLPFAEGEATLTVKALSKPGDGVMNLRSVRLRPTG
jgi:alpha-L-fucosidase